MSVNAPPRVVLDSDVVYSRVMHELFGRLASEARLLTIIWSEELLGEAQRVLIDRKGLEPAVGMRWVSYLREAFPMGRVDIALTMRNEPLNDLTTDPDDQHVCALAIGGHADLLIASDRGFVAKPLARRGIEVISPDRQLTRTFTSEPTAVLTALAEQAAAWGGGRPVGNCSARLNGRAHTSSRRPPAPRSATRPTSHGVGSGWEREGTRSVPRCPPRSSAPARANEFRAWRNTACQVVRQDALRVPWPNWLPWGPAFDDVRVQGP